MITLGIVLLLLGLFIGVPVLVTIGVVLAVVGAALALLGAFGRPVGSRAHYW